MMNREEICDERNKKEMEKTKGFIIHPFIRPSIYWSVKFNYKWEKKLSLFYRSIIQILIEEEEEVEKL